MNRLERVGMGLSLLCAIHCAATPVLLAAMPVLESRLPHSHWLEGLILGVVILIGYPTLGASFRRHRRSLPLMLLSLGLGLVILGHTILPETAETAIAVLGGLMLAGAQFLNRRYAGAVRCACCHHAAAPASPAGALHAGAHSDH